LPRFKGLVAAAALAAGCASAPPAVNEPAPPAVPTALALPATYVNKPGCPGCLAITVTLRTDGSFLSREQLGSAEFYDFGRWRLAGETLELAGGRDVRRYALPTLTRTDKVEPLRGPFRLVGHFDGAGFRECRTGVRWEFTDNKLGALLRRQLEDRDANPAIVALDAQLEGAPEKLRLVRPGTFLSTRTCPG
jgi:hypothetical protein